MLQMRKQSLREVEEQEQKQALNVQFLNCGLIAFYWVAVAPGIIQCFNDIFNNHSINN